MPALVGPPPTVNLPRQATYTARTPVDLAAAINLWAAEHGHLGHPEVTRTIEQILHTPRPHLPEQLEDAIRRVIQKRGIVPRTAWDITATIRLDRANASSTTTNTDNPRPLPLPWWYSFPHLPDAPVYQAQVSLFDAGALIMHGFNTGGETYYTPFSLHRAKYPIDFPGKPYWSSCVVQSQEDFIAMLKDLPRDERFDVGEHWGMVLPELKFGTVDEIERERVRGPSTQPDVEGMDDEQGDGVFWTVAVRTLETIAAIGELEKIDRSRRVWV